MDPKFPRFSDVEQEENLQPDYPEDEDLPMPNIPNAPVPQLTLSDETKKDKEGNVENPHVQGVNFNSYDKDDDISDSEDEEAGCLDTPSSIQKHLSEKEKKEKLKIMDSYEEDLPHKSMKGSTFLEHNPFYQGKLPKESNLINKKDENLKTNGYMLPWFFKSNLVPIVEIDKINSKFQNLQEGENYMEFLQNFLENHHFLFPGIRSYFLNQDLFSPHITKTIVNILRTSKDGLRPLQEAEELVSLITETALSQRQYEMSFQKSVELDQYKMIIKSLQSSLKVASETFEEATKGISADRSLIQSIHKELKEKHLDCVVYKSVPSPVEKEARPRKSQTIHRDYLANGATVTLMIPGKERTIDITTVGSTKELRATLLQIREVINPNETKILNEAGAGFFKTVDLIFEHHGLKLKN